MSVVSVHNVEAWREANKDCFAPPICNKLMHKDQLSIMFVGGPNTRTDFHIEEGSEFFFQVKGCMHLPTVQQGQRKVVHIREGEVFLLPPRVPHSPQRPEDGSFGLVVERRRDADELDGLRWYTDFDKCDEVLWERFFHCGDLGRDLVPVVQAYLASEESKTMKPKDNVLPEHARPVKQDHHSLVPDPFPFADFVAAHADELARGAALPLFPSDHPDNEAMVLVCGGPGRQDKQAREGETWLYQHKGAATVVAGGGEERTRLEEGCCCVVPGGVAFGVEREAGSVGLVVSMARAAPRPN